MLMYVRRHTSASLSLSRCLSACSSPTLFLPPVPFLAVCLLSMCFFYLLLQRLLRNLRGFLFSSVAAASSLLASSSASRQRSTE